MAKKIYGATRELTRTDAEMLAGAIAEAAVKTFKKLKIHLTPDETFYLLYDICDFVEEICAVEPKEETPK